MASFFERQGIDLWTYNPTNAFCVLGQNSKFSKFCYFNNNCNTRSPTLRGYSEVTLESSTTSHFFSMRLMSKIYFQAGFVFGFFTIGFRRYGPFSLITAALLVLFAIPVE